MSKRRKKLAYAARAGKSVSFDTGAPKTSRRYFVDAGTPVLVMKHGVPLTAHETKEVQQFTSDNGPFSAKGGRWGFLVDGWVFLVHPSKVKVYGEI